MAQTAQKYENTFEYKGLTVIPKAQKVAQKWPKLDQIELAQTEEVEDCAPVMPALKELCSAVFVLVIDVISGSVEAYAKNRRKKLKYSKLRREARIERARIQSIKANTKSRGDAKDKSQVIQVSGGTNYITINNY